MIRLCFKVVILLAGSMLMFSCTSTDVVLPANKPPNIFCNGSLSTRPWAKNSTCYRPSLVKSMQTILSQYGFDAGQEDGVFGGRTLAAYTSFLKSQNREADAYLTSQTIRYIKSLADDYPSLSPKTKIVNISEQPDAISPRQTRPARPVNPQLQRQIAELQKLERELRNPDGSYKKEDVRSREEIAADNTAKSFALDMSRLVLGKPVRLTQTNRRLVAYSHCCFALYSSRFFPTQSTQRVD